MEMNTMNSVKARQVTECKRKKKEKRNILVTPSYPRTFMKCILSPKWLFSGLNETNRFPLQPYEPHSYVKSPLFM